MVAYDLRAVAYGTLFVGFHRGWVWLAVLLSALGGIAVSMALKYADNILKTFAVGCSIVLNCGISSLFLGVPLTLPVVTGVLLVVGSTFLFNAREMRGVGSASAELRSCNGGLPVAASSGSAASRSLEEETAPLRRGGESPVAHAAEERMGKTGRPPPLEYHHASHPHRGSHQQQQVQPMQQPHCASGSPTDECVRRSTGSSSPRAPQQPGALHAAPLYGQPAPVPSPKGTDEGDRESRETDRLLS